MNKWTKFAAGLALGLSLASGVAWTAGMSTAQKLYFQKAFKNDDLANWVVGISNMDFKQPAGFLTSNVDAKSANARKIHFKLKDNTDLNRAGGVAAAQESQLTSEFCYMSDNSAGGAFVTTAGTSAWTGVASSGAVLSLVTGKSGQVISPASGWTTVVETQTSSTVNTQYFCCQFPDHTVACTAGFTP